jgi:hypothetical protein
LPYSQDIEFLNPVRRRLELASFSTASPPEEEAIAVFNECIAAVSTEKSFSPVDGPRFPVGKSAAKLENLGIFSKFSSSLTLKDRGRNSCLYPRGEGDGIDDQLNGFGDGVFAVVGGDVRKKRWWYRRNDRIDRWWGRTIVDQRWHFGVSQKEFIPRTLRPLSAVVRALVTSKVRG